MKECAQCSEAAALIDWSAAYGICSNESSPTRPLHYVSPQLITPLSSTTFHLYRLLCFPYCSAAMRVDREDRDDDHTARIMRGFQYIMTPGAGLVVMPLVLLSLVSLWRKRIIPRVASEAYR